VGFLHLFRGVYLQLTIPHISVYSFQTVSHTCRVPPSPLIDSGLFTETCPRREVLKPSGISGIFHCAARVDWPFLAALLLCVHMGSTVSERETSRRGTCSQRKYKCTEPFRSCGTENVSSDLSSPTGNVAFCGIRPRDARRDWRCLIVLKIGPWLVVTRNFGIG
jgi:hypothetical protein